MKDAPLYEVNKEEERRRQEEERKKRLGNRWVVVEDIRRSPLPLSLTQQRPQKPLTSLRPVDQHKIYPRSKISHPLVRETETCRPLDDRRPTDHPLVAISPPPAVPPTASLLLVAHPRIFPHPDARPTSRLFVPPLAICRRLAEAPPPVGVRGRISCGSRLRLDGVVMKGLLQNGFLKQRRGLCRVPSWRRR
jgi:hypothetical protein